MSNEKKARALVKLHESWVKKKMNAGRLTKVCLTTHLKPIGKFVKRDGPRRLRVANEKQ